ncbi:LysE family translocator [Vibrio fluminensis]|uniref:LysE family translocator n=1 Tax=Vibrio fluminensis TaxID=2783614 RepID=UPI001887B241|nr:LysE family transporter [Vibrio fluminensis]
MSLFFLWFSVMFPLVFSPGPANIVFAASGAKVGVKRSIPLLTGVDSVFIVKSLVIGFGLGKFVENYPHVMNAMQILGALYLLYLGAKFIQTDAKSEISVQKTLGFVDGLVIQLLNSKGWLMVFLMFTLFTDQAYLLFGEQGTLVLVLWLAILNISIHLVWIKMGQLLAKVSNSPSYQKAMNLFYASCLFVVSGWLIVDNPIWEGIAEISSL